MKKLLALAIALSLSDCGGGGGANEPAAAPILSVSTTSILLSATVGADFAETSIDVRNTGGGTLAFRANTASQELALAPASGNLIAGASATIRLTYTCRRYSTWNSMQTGSPTSRRSPGCIA